MAPGQVTAAPQPSPPNNVIVCICGGPSAFKTALPKSVGFQRSPGSKERPPCPAPEQDPLPPAREAGLGCHCQAPWGTGREGGGPPSQGGDGEQPFLLVQPELR